MTDWVAPIAGALSEVSRLEDKKGRLGGALDYLRDEHHQMANDN